MIRRLRQFVRRQQFNPHWLGAFVNPFFLARRQLWRAITEAGPSLSGPLLDVGCGTKPYRELFATDNYVGLDIDSEVARARGSADAYYSGDRFPFDDAQFQSVLCNQVLEHVFNPDEFIGEIRRVLSRGGKLLLTVPFVWDEHEQPYDYARYSSFGLHALLERQGFRVLRHRKLMADASLIFQLINAYLFKVGHTRFTSLNLIVTALVFGPISLLGLLMGTVMPKNPDLFLDQLVVAEKV